MTNDEKERRQMKTKLLQLEQYVQFHPVKETTIKYRVAYISLLKHIVDKYKNDDGWSECIFLFMKNCIAPNAGFFDMEINDDGIIFSKRNKGVLKSSFPKVRYNLLTDCLFICAFNDQIQGKKILTDICEIFPKSGKKRLNRLFKNFYDINLGQISKQYPTLLPIYKVIKRNRLFLQKPEKKIMVTANMSAGKSTLLNAFAGKKINKTQNEVCTAKIHYMYNKAGEDKLNAKFDHKLILNTSLKKLMTDEEENKTNEIMVSTRFRSLTQITDRICFIDTPGVNSAANKEHRDMTNDVISDENCDLLIYLLNGENIGTEDDRRHLKYVKERYHGEMIFLINKLDKYRKGEDSVPETIQKAKEELQELGYNNARIYPISALAAYLAKMSLYGEQLSEDEIDDLNYRKRKLSKEEFMYYTYYDIESPKIDEGNDMERLLRNSGLLSLEKMIYCKNKECYEKREYLEKKEHSEKEDTEKKEYFERKEDHKKKKHNEEEKQMKKIYIKYNPYKVETEIKIDGKEPKSNSKFHVGNQRLQEWIDDLPKMLLEECNTRDFELVFYGTTPDYEDILASAEEAKKDNINIKVVEHIPAKEVKDKEKAIQKVFNKIQNGPFEELKKPNITRAFELAKSSEFEVDVVATMSAGKSTLINALLGQKLMPSKNEACTAIITEIKDNGKDCFKAKVYDKKGKLIKSYNELDYMIMKNLNDNENVSKIRTEGNIPFVTSEDTALVLVDTPGPNNARNPEHRITTQKMLSESSKALVLYIMNATSMGSYDDHRLLRAVAESMKVGGKQSRDRFIFVVNKLDEFKKGEDNVLESLAKVRSYLEDNGIENPNVYPESALTALDIRTILKQEDADDDDDDVWDAKGRVRKFNNNTERYFEKYAPLPTSVKNKIEDRLDKAINNKDVNEQALIHSGVVPIEEAIKIYVTKYANTAKIKNIVDTFQGSLESAKTFETARNQIVRDKEHREEIVDKIASIQTKLASGEEAKKFKDKIEKINYDTEIDNIATQIIGQAQKKTTDYLTNRKEKMTIEEAQDLCKELVKVTDREQVEVQVKLENLIENNLQNQAKKLVETYKEKLQELAEEVKINDIEIDPFKMMEGEIPINISAIIHESTKTERVKTGEEWIENTDKKWYKPWTWFQESGWYRDIMEDKEYVSRIALAQKFLAKIQENLWNNRNAASAYAKRQAKIIKDYFKGKFEELDEILKTKLEELNNCTKDEKEAAENLADSERKLAWLEDIKKRMDDILEI